MVNTGKNTGTQHTPQQAAKQLDPCPQGTVVNQRQILMLTHAQTGSGPNNVT